MKKHGTVSLIGSLALPIAAVVFGLTISLRGDSGRFSELLGYSAAALGAVLLASGTLNIPGLIRNERLERRVPGALTLLSTSSKQLRGALVELRKAENVSITEPPYSLTVLARPGALEVWGGVTSLKRLYRFPSEKIAGIEPTTVDRPTWRGMNIGVRSDKGQVVQLAFSAFGAGPLGIFTLSPRRLASTIAQMEEVMSTPAASGAANSEA